MAPVVQARVKLEINTREHFAVHGFATRSLEVENRWFSGAAEIATYTMPELLGTKLRALYQRKKGRDLLDLDLALDHPEFNADLLLEAFGEYMTFGGTPVTRAQFEGEHDGEDHRRRVRDGCAPAAEDGPRSRTRRGVVPRSCRAAEPPARRPVERRRRRRVAPGSAAFGGEQHGRAARGR